jgi:DNA-binding MarR family transcriptional regulator
VQTASADTELAARLRDALARTGRRLRQEAGTGLSPSLLMALASIEREGPLTPSELAVRERIQRPTVTRILARLEEGGLVSRAPDPADRRSSLVTATAAGRALLAESRTRKDAFLSARLDELSPEDRATLAQAAMLLERMLAEPAA